MKGEVKINKMNATIEKAIGLLEILPENDQNFALEFIKKLVVAWKKWDDTP